MFYVVANSIINITNIYDAADVDTWIKKQDVRIVASFLSLAIFGKMVYFLKLIDQIAPLVHIIIRVFYDIRWFIAVMLVSIFAFANSFYILAKN